MKRAVGDLAIFGGEPAFPEKLHVGRPNIGDRSRFLARLEDILDSRWLSNAGPYVRGFERRVEELLGVRHCIATCNATLGLEIVARAAGLEGEVIIPSFTFVATAHALQWQHIKPVFADIDPLSHNLDPSSVERMISSRTTGIVAVHTWGRPCDVETLAEIADRRHLRLIYDAAHAFHCTAGGRMIGNFGDAEVFSFHATKFVNAFEGGAIVTNDSDLASTVRAMVNFGLSGHEHVSNVGTNAKMSEPCAAMAITSLESLTDIVNINRRNYHTYQSEFASIPGAILSAYEESELCNYQYIVMEVNELDRGLSRDQLLEVLTAENVLARRYFYPGCHQLEPYRATEAEATPLVNTERLVRRVLSLPTGTAVSEDAVRVICGIIRLALEQPRPVAERLAARGESR